jgi:hypothetical protein
MHALVVPTGDDLVERMARAFLLKPPPPRPEKLRRRSVA